MQGGRGSSGQASAGLDGRMLADFDGAAYGSDYLTLACNERVLLLADRPEDAGWAYGVRSDGMRGWFPSSYWEPTEAPAESSSMLAAASAHAGAAAAPSSAMAQGDPDDSGPPLPSWFKGSPGASSSAGPGASSLASALSSFGPAADAAGGPSPQQGVGARAAGKQTGASSSTVTLPSADVLAESRQQLMKLLSKDGDTSSMVPAPPPAAQVSKAGAAALKAEPSWKGVARAAAGRASTSTTPAVAARAELVGGSSSVAQASSQLDDGLNGPPGGSLPTTALPVTISSWQRRIYTKGLLLQARESSAKKGAAAASSAGARSELLGITLAPRLVARPDAPASKLREGALATLLELAGGSAKVGQLAAAVLALGIKTGSHSEVCQGICVEVCNKPDVFVPLLEGALGMLEVNKLVVALRPSAAAPASSTAPAPLAAPPEPPRPTAFQNQSV